MHTRLTSPLPIFIILIGNDGIWLGLIHNGQQNGGVVDQFSKISKILIYLYPNTGSYANVEMLKV